MAKREDISVELDVSVTEELKKQAASVTKISSAISSIKSGAEEAAGPIKQIATDMKSIATSSSDFVKSFGDLRKAFDELKKLNVSAATEKLKKGQDKIEEFTSKVRGAASELADLTNKISSATSGIASASEGIKSVSTAVSSLSTSIEKANSVIDAFASRARQLSEAVQSVANSVARINELEAKARSAETRAKAETTKRRSTRRRQPEPEPEPTPEPSRGGRRIIGRISAVGQYVRTEPEPPPSPRPRRGGARAHAVQQYGYTAPLTDYTAPSYRGTQQQLSPGPTMQMGHYESIRASAGPDVPRRPIGFQPSRQAQQHVPNASKPHPPPGYRYGFGFGEDPTRLYPIKSESTRRIERIYGMRRRIGFTPPGESEFVDIEDEIARRPPPPPGYRYGIGFAEDPSRLYPEQGPSYGRKIGFDPRASASALTPVSMQAGAVYAGPSGGGGKTVLGHASVTTGAPRRRRGGRRPSLYRWMDAREAKRRFADLSDRPLDEILDLLKTKEEREALKKKTQAIQTGQFRILDLTNEVEDFFRAKRAEELRKLPKEEREFRSPFYIPEEIDIAEDPIMHEMLKVYKDLKKVPEAMNFVATRAREKLSGERVRQFREVLRHAGFSEEDIEKGRFHVPFMPLSVAAGTADRTTLANIMLGGGGRKQAAFSYALKHVPHALTPAGSAFTTAIFERGLGSDLFNDAYVRAFAQAKPETQTYIMKRISSLPRSREYQYAQRMRLFFADLYKRSPEPAVKLMREFGPAVESLAFSPQDIVSVWREIRSAVPGGLEKTRTFADFLKFVAPAEQPIWSGMFVGKTISLSSAIRDLKDKYEKGELSKGNLEDLKSLAASVRLLSRSFRTKKDRPLSQLEIGKRINDLISGVTSNKFYKVLPANVRRDVDRLISGAVSPMLGEPEQADMRQLFDVASDIRVKLFGRQAETVGQMFRRLSGQARKVLSKDEFKTFEKALEAYRPAKSQKVPSDVIFKDIYQDVMYGAFGNEELSKKLRGVMASEWHRVRTTHDPFEYARKHVGEDFASYELKDAYIKQRSLQAMTRDVFDILPGPSPYKYYGVRAPLFVSAEPYEEQAKIALVTRAKMKYLPAFKDKNVMSGIARLYELFGGVNPAKLVEKAEGGNALAAAEANALLPKKGEDWLQHLGKLALSRRVGMSMDIFGRNINEAVQRQRNEARAMRRRMRMMQKIEREARRNDPFSDQKLEAAMEAEEPLKRVFAEMYGRTGVKLQEKQIERLVDLTLGSDFWNALRLQDALEVQKKPERFVMTMMELLGFPSASVVGMGKLPSYEQLTESLAKHGDTFLANAIGVSRDVERELKMLGISNIIAGEVSKSTAEEEAPKKGRGRKKEAGAAELTPSEVDVSKIKRALRNKGSKLSKKTASIPLTAQELIEMAANLGKGRRSIPEGVDIESAFEQRKKNIAEFASLLGIDPKSSAGQKRLKGWEEYLEKLKESGNISQLVFPNVAEWLLASGVRGRPTPEVEEMNLRIASWLHERGLLAGTSNTILRWRKFFEEQGGQTTNAIASQMIKPSKPSGPQASAAFTPMMAGGMYSGMPGGGMSMVGGGAYSTGPTMQFGQYSFTPYAETESPRAMAAGGGRGKGGGKKGGGFFGFMGGGGGGDDDGGDDEEKEPPKKPKRGRKKKSTKEEIDWTSPRSATGDKTIDFIVDRVTKMVGAIRKPELTMPGSQESFFREVVMPAVEVLNALGVSGKPVSGPLKGRAGKKLKNQLKQMGIDVEKMGDIDLGMIAGMPKDFFDYLKHLFKTTPATPRQRSRASESLEHITETAILQGKVAGGEVDLYPWQLQTIKRLASLLGPEVGQFAYGLFQMGNMFKTLTQASQLAASSPSPYLYEKRVTTGPAKQTYLKARRGKAMASAADLIAKAESQAEAFRMISEGTSLLPPKDLAKAIETYMKTGDEEVFKQTIDSMLRREAAKTQYEQKILQKRNVVDEFKRIELTKKAVEMIRSGRTKLRDVDDVVKYLEVKEEYGKEVGQQIYRELVQQQEALDALAKERKQRTDAAKKLQEQKRKTKEAIEKAKRERAEEILPSEAARQWQELAQFGKPIYFGRSRRFTRQYFEREFGVDFSRFIPTEEHISALVRLRKLQSEAGSDVAAREAEKTFSVLFTTQRQREMMVDWKRRRREIEREQLEADRLQREMEINRQAMENIRLRKTPIKDLRLETQAVRVEEAARRAGYSPEEVAEKGRGFRDVAQQYERELTHFRRLKISWEELLRYMGRVFVGLQAFDMLRQAISMATRVTVGFATQMQDARIGIIASTGALSRYTLGRLGAQLPMAEQVKLIGAEATGNVLMMKQASLRMGIPLDQLLEGYQVAAGVAKQAGFTGGNLIRAISGLVAFSQAMNISMSTLARTIDNVFSGQRIAQVTLGRMLGLSERKVREAVESGKFRELLLERLEPIQESVKELGATSIRVQGARAISAMSIYFNRALQPIMDTAALGLGVATSGFTSMANRMVLDEALQPQRGTLGKIGRYALDILPLAITIGGFFGARKIAEAMKTAYLARSPKFTGDVAPSAASQLPGLAGLIAGSVILGRLSGVLVSGGTLWPVLALTGLSMLASWGTSKLISKFDEYDKNKMLRDVQESLNYGAMASSAASIFTGSNIGSAQAQISVANEMAGLPKKPMSLIEKLRSEIVTDENTLKSFYNANREQLEKFGEISAEEVKNTARTIKSLREKLARMHVVLEDLRKAPDAEKNKETIRALEEFIEDKEALISRFTDVFVDLERLSEVKKASARALAELTEVSGALAQHRAEQRMRLGYRLEPMQLITAAAQQAGAREHEVKLALELDPVARKYLDKKFEDVLADVQKSERDVPETVQRARAEEIWARAQTLKSRREELETRKKIAFEQALFAERMHALERRQRAYAISGDIAGLRAKRLEVLSSVFAKAYRGAELMSVSELDDFYRRSLRYALAPFAAERRALDLRFRTALVEAEKSPGMRRLLIRRAALEREQAIEQQALRRLQLREELDTMLGDIFMRKIGLESSVTQAVARYKGSRIVSLAPMSERAGVVGRLRSTEITRRGLEAQLGMIAEFRQTIDRKIQENEQRLQDLAFDYDKSAAVKAEQLKRHIEKLKMMRLELNREATELQATNYELTAEAIRMKQDYLIRRAKDIVGMESEAVQLRARIVSGFSSVFSSFRGVEMIPQQGLGGYYGQSVDMLYRLAGLSRAYGERQLDLEEKVAELEARRNPDLAQQILDLARRRKEAGRVGLELTDIEARERIQGAIADATSRRLSFLVGGVQAQARYGASRTAAISPMSEQAQVMAKLQSLRMTSRGLAGVIPEYGQFNRTLDDLIERTRVELRELEGQTGEHIDIKKRSLEGHLLALQAMKEKTNQEAMNTWSSIIENETEYVRTLRTFQIERALRILGLHSEVNQLRSRQVGEMIGVLAGGFRGIEMAPAESLPQFYARTLSLMRRSRAYDERQLEFEFKSSILEARRNPDLASAILQTARERRQIGFESLLIRDLQAREGVLGTIADAAVRRAMFQIAEAQSRGRYAASLALLANPLSERTAIGAQLQATASLREAMLASLPELELGFKAVNDEIARQTQELSRYKQGSNEWQIVQRGIYSLELTRAELERKRLDTLSESNELLARELQLRMELYRRSFVGGILSGLISGGPFAMFQSLAQRGEQTLNVAFARLLGYITSPRAEGREQRAQAENVQINVSGGAGKYSLGGDLIDGLKKAVGAAGGPGGQKPGGEGTQIGAKLAGLLGMSPETLEGVGSIVGASYQGFRVVSGTIESVGEIQDRIRMLRNQVGWTLNPDKYASRAIAEVLRPFGLSGLGKLAGMSNVGKAFGAAAMAGVGAGTGALAGAAIGAIGGPIGAGIGALIGAGLGALFGAFGASGFGLFKPPTPPSRLRRGLQRVFDELGIPRDARGGRGISFEPTAFSEITGEIGAATGLYLRKRYPGLGDLGLLPIRMIYATAQAGKALGLAREDTEYLARSVSKKLVPSLEAAAMALASLYRKGAIGQKDFLSGAAGIARIFGELPPAINASALAVNAFARDGSISFERLKRTIQDAQQVVSRGIADAVRLGVESGGSIALTGQAIGDAFSDAFLQRVTERLMQRKDIGDALTRAVTEAESAAELLAEGRTQEYAVQIQKVMSLIAESQTKVAQIISPVTQALYSVRTTLGIGVPGVYAQIGFGAYNAQYIANQPARYLYKDTGESPAAYAPRAFRTEDIEKMGQVISGAVATAIERSGSNQKVVLNIDGGEFGTAVSGVMYKQSKTRGIQVSTPQMVGLE